MDARADNRMPVGLLGASGFVGRAVRARLDESGWRAIPVSHRDGETSKPVDRDVRIPRWIATCPIWVLPGHLARLEAAGVSRLVAISSTSRFTKSSSTDAGERAIACKLAAAETTVIEWAAPRGVVTTILRPTLIYDGVHDRNVVTIAAFIRRWGFFPVLGAARGLRQPIHVDDVATACVASLDKALPEPAYDLSGAETLPYREMVKRIFESLGRPPRIVGVPRWAVQAGVAVLNAIPGSSPLTVAMFDRMNDDMAFDHSAASRDLPFEPRAFKLPAPDRCRSC